MIRHHGEVADADSTHIHPFLRERIPTYGYIYDVTSGLLVKVPEAAAVAGADALPEEFTLDDG